MSSNISTTISQVSLPTTSQILSNTQQQDATDNAAISELLELRQPPIPTIASQTATVPTSSSTLKSKPADDSDVLVQGCTIATVTTYNGLLIYLLVLFALGLFLIVIVRSLFSLVSTQTRLPFAFPTASYQTEPITPTHPAIPTSSTPALGVDLEPTTSITDFVFIEATPEIGQVDVSFSEQQDDTTLIGSEDDTIIYLEDEHTFTLEDIKEVFFDLGILKVQKGVQEQQLFVEQEDSDQASKALVDAADSISPILGEETHAHASHPATYNHRAVQTGSEEAIADLPKDSTINRHIDVINVNLGSLHTLGCMGCFIIDEGGRFCFVSNEEPYLPRPAIVLEQTKVVEIEEMNEENEQFDEEIKAAEDIVKEIKQTNQELTEISREIKQIKMAEEEILKTNKPTVVSTIEEKVKVVHHTPDISRVAEGMKHPKKSAEAPTHFPVTSRVVTSVTTTLKSSCPIQQQNKTFAKPWHTGINIKFKERQLAYILENSAWLFYVPRHGRTIWPPKSTRKSGKVNAPKIVVTDTDASADEVKLSERIKDVEAAPIAPNVAIACPAELVVLEATPTLPPRVEEKPLAVVTRAPSLSITSPRKPSCAPSSPQKVYSRRKENQPPRMQTPPTPPFTPKRAYLYAQNYYLPVMDTKTSPARVREGPLPVPIPKEFDHTVSLSPPVTPLARRIKPNLLVL